MRRLSVTAAPHVTLYSSPGCRLCDRARAVLEAVRAEQPFDFREVDISRDDELEARYRELLPVVDVEGRRRFVYFVPPDALKRALADAQTERAEPGL
ncbi:MAG: glutaredoxin family protein [Thermoleophilia bacterium]|nr:glutaredoxin family protein [Thermoleophilia bacterium]